LHRHAELAPELFRDIDNATDTDVQHIRKNVSLLEPLLFW
jgi:hypothetical protein